MQKLFDYSSRFRILKGGKISLVVSALCAGSTISYAAPSGGTVTTGSASISQSGSVTTINQSSDRASINWQSFSIAPSETVNFLQPSASSITLNRVVGTTQSMIEGAMNANGQVFLVNPNGVVFSKDAQINVGGIVASTLDITDENFQSGNYVFEGSSNASIINMGSITAAQGGYVAMMGKSVQNEGTIVATMGNVQMASGEKIALNLNGNSLLKLTIDQGTLNAFAENKGIIKAEGGEVYLTTQALNTILDGMVNNTGIIEAQSIGTSNGRIVLEGTSAINSGVLDASGKDSGEFGGIVKVLGSTVNLAEGSNIDVSGDAGGTALIGGNFHGAGVEQNAQTAAIAADTMINADAITNGNGGNVAVWSDGQTTFDGTISARGGANGGDGGFVETSGKQRLTVGVNARVNTLAPLGKTGEWLLDPTDFTIYAGGTGDILDSTLITNLGGGNVTILSSNGGSGTNGDIILNSDVWVQWGAPTTLTLSAYRHVNVNGWLDTIGAGGSGSIVLRADNTGTGTGTVNIATGISSGGTSLIATQGVGSTTIYTNAPTSTTGYKADGPADCASGSFCGTFNVYQLVRTDTAGVVNNKIYDGTTAATMQTPFGLVGSPAGATLTAGTATFDTKNIGTGKSVTFSGYSAGGTVGLAGGVTATYYLSNQPTGLTANITPAAITVSGITASNKTYDATTAATLGGTAAVSALGSDTVTVGGTGSGTFADKNVGNGKAVTVTGYTLGGADAGNYTIVQPTGVTANITAANLAVTGVTAGNKTYDGTTAATLGGTAAVTALGSDTVTVGGTGSGTFANKNVGNGKAVTVSGYTLGGVDAGNYTVVQPTGVTANITPAAITVSGITAGNKTYDATTAATVNTAGAVFTGKVGGDTVTVSATGTFADKNVANGKTVTLASSYGGADAGNYTITDQATTTANITPANLTVTGVTAGNKTYDATTAATLGGTAAVTALGSDTVTVGGTGSGTFADKNVGNGKAVTVTGYTLGGADAGNYTIVQPTGVTANITAANLAVTGVIANSKTYDGTTAATLAGVATVFAFGGDTVTVGGTGSGTFADKNVGTGKTVTIAGYTLGGADAGNYTIVQPGGTANITAKAMTLSGIAAANKVYDGTTSATVNAAGAVFTGLVGGDTVTVSATGAFADKSVANGKTVTLTSSYGGADAGNYAITDQASATANITPKSMSVSGIVGNNKVYDGTTAATANTAGATLTGLVGGDTVTVSATGTFADKNVANGKTVTLASTYGGADAGNYTFTDQVSTTANITAAALTLGGITAGNKVYDGTTAATLNTAGVTFTGLLGADVVTLGGAGTGTFADKNVANGKSVTVSGYTLGGADAANYSVGQPTGLTANITPASITVSGITTANKTYDATTAATVNTAGAVFTGKIGGDTVTVSSSGTFADKNVANGKTVTLASTYGGADAGNYTFTDQAAATANITAKAVTLTAPSVSKTYDGGLTYTATAGDLTTLSGSLVGGDTVTAATLAYTNKNVGTNKTVNLNAATISDGNGGNNYSVTLAGNTTGTITAAPLSVSANAAAKTYDGLAYSGGNGVTFSGFVTGEGSGVLGGTLAYSGDSQGAVDVGNYTITPGGYTSGNYTIAYNNGTLTINPEPVIVPVQTTGNPTAIDNVLQTIINQTAVTPPPLVNPNIALIEPTATPTSLDMTSFTPAGGDSRSFTVVGTTDGDEAVQTVSLDQLRRIGLTQDNSDIRVSLGQGSFIELLNGGTRLPNGLSQEFYVVNDKTKNSN